MRGLIPAFALYSPIFSACTLLFLGLLCVTPLSQALAQPLEPSPTKPMHDREAQSAIAMHGFPKYSPGFTHFDYVNPDAPQGGTLRLGATGTFDSLNPFTILGIAPLGLNTGYLSLVYESLMTRSADEPFTLYGLIAESIDVPDDRSRITFNLNPTARWADNTPLTTADVIFSYNILKEKGRPNHRTYYKKIKDVDVQSPTRITFTFKDNGTGLYDREMPMIMGLMPILPAHAWKGRDFGATTRQLPLGSGPYQVSQMDIGRSITYSRRQDYWGKTRPTQRGLYNFDTIRIDYYRDDHIALEAFKAHQFDLRRETNPALWATAYDTPAARDGRLARTLIPHKRTETTTAFAFNTRRPLLKDPQLRQALILAFDHDWVNKNLFYGQMHTITSYFPNSELASPPPTLSPFTDFRAQLLSAQTLLSNTGYTLVDGQLHTPAGVPVRLDLMLSDPTEEKIALTWARNLEKLGIVLHIRTVDSAQFQRRLSQFDYDCVSIKWQNSLSPGNEQSVFWGSNAAYQNGSRNYPGISDPSIDQLTTAIPRAMNRHDLVALTQSLDQHLVNGYYSLLLFYAGYDRYAYWRDQIAHPEPDPLSGTILESWWAQPTASQTPP